MAQLRTEYTDIKDITHQVEHLTVPVPDDRTREQIMEELLFALTKEDHRISEPVSYLNVCGFLSGFFANRGAKPQESFVDFKAEGRSVAEKPAGKTCAWMLNRLLA